MCNQCATFSISNTPILLGFAPFARYDRCCVSRFHILSSVPMQPTAALLAPSSTACASGEICSLGCDCRACCEMCKFAAARPVDIPLQAHRVASAKTHAESIPCALQQLRHARMPLHFSSKTVLSIPCKVTSQYLHT